MKDYTGLKIENKNQFDKVYHLFRSAKNGLTLLNYANIYGYPTFPIYLEKIKDSYGYCTEPIGTLDKKAFAIINFNDVTF